MRRAATEVKTPQIYIFNVTLASQHVIPFSDMISFGMCLDTSQLNLGILLDVYFHFSLRYISSIGRATVTVTGRLGGFLSLYRDRDSLYPVGTVHKQ